MKIDRQELNKFVKELQAWLGNNPYRDAQLIEKVPISASTLARLKSGWYQPSTRMVNAIRSTMKGN